MKLKKFLVWILTGSVTFVLTACYGAPVRPRDDKGTVNINNNTIKGLDYEAFAENNRELSGK